MSKKFFVLILLACLCVPVFSAFAGPNDPPENNPPKNDPVQTTAPSTTSLTNPLGGTKDVPTLIKNVINAALGIVGSLALLMFIYGGFMWMLSAGNEKMVTNGKNTLMWAALGLVVIFMSYALVNFVITKVTAG